MKLMTEVRDGQCVSSQGWPMNKESEVTHDAAAAHALMQAMREAGDGSADVAFYSDDDYQNWVYARADSLMREWGFDSGEAGES